MAHSKKTKQMASKAAGSAAGRSARTSPSSTSNSATPLAGSTTPASAKAVLQKQGEHAMERDGVKASIQYARHGGGWVAEFRFALRSGLCWACTLPLTTSSAHFDSEAKALAHAARRMLDSLSAAIHGDKLTKAQQKSVDALVAWATDFLAVVYATLISGRVSTLKVASENCVMAAFVLMLNSHHCRHPFA